MYESLIRFYYEPTKGGGFLEDFSLSDGLIIFGIICNKFLFNISKVLSLIVLFNVFG